MKKICLMPMVHIYYAKKDKAVGGMGGGTTGKNLTTENDK